MKVNAIRPDNTIMQFSVDIGDEIIIVTSIASAKPQNHCHYKTVMIPRIPAPTKEQLIKALKGNMKTKPSQVAKTIAQVAKTMDMTPLRLCLMLHMNGITPIEAAA